MSVLTPIPNAINNKYSNIYCRLTVNDTEKLEKTFPYSKHLNDTLNDTEKWWKTFSYSKHLKMISQTM